MTERHEVAEGECISSLAFEHGLAVDTIWNDPANAELKQSRDDPYVLNPGDVVFIPDLRPGSAAIQTGRRHRFRRKNVPEKLKLRLLDEGEPRASLPFVIEIDGKQQEGVTDADGGLEIFIPPNAMQGMLVISDSETWELRLGAIAPVETENGARQRLVNLGFLQDDAGDDALSDAVTLFQSAQQLPASGELDDTTRTKLRDAHGS